MAVKTSTVNYIRAAAADLGNGAAASEHVQLAAEHLRLHIDTQVLGNRVLDEIAGNPVLGAALGINLVEREGFVVECARKQLGGLRRTLLRGNAIAPVAITATRAGEAVAATRIQACFRAHAVCKRAGVGRRSQRERIRRCLARFREADPAAYRERVRLAALLFQNRGTTVRAIPTVASHVDNGLDGLESLATVRFEYKGPTAAAAPAAVNEGVTVVVGLRLGFLLEPHLMALFNGNDFYHLVAEGASADRMGGFFQLRAADHPWGSLPEAVIQELRNMAHNGQGRSMQYWWDAGFHRRARQARAAAGR